VPREEEWHLNGTVDLKTVIRYKNKIGNEKRKLVISLEQKGGMKLNAVLHQKGTSETD